jgi:hypothetical protein
MTGSGRMVAKFVGGPRDDETVPGWPDPPPPYYTAEGTHYELSAITDLNGTPTAVYRVMPAGKSPPRGHDVLTFRAWRPRRKPPGKRRLPPRPVRVAGQRRP